MDVRDGRGLVAFHTACSVGNLAMATALLEVGASSPCLDTAGRRHVIFCYRMGSRLDQNLGNELCHRFVSDASAEPVLSLCLFHDVSFSEAPQAGPVVFDARCFAQTRS